MTKYLLYIVSCNLTYHLVHENIYEINTVPDSLSGNIGVSNSIVDYRTNYWCLDSFPSHVTKQWEPAEIAGISLYILDAITLLHKDRVLLQCLVYG